MIRPLPTNDAGRALARLVCGGLAAAELAADLWPPPVARRAGPVRGDLRRWRAERDAARIAHEERVRIHTALTVSRARRVLSRLAQAGLVSPHGGYGLTAVAWRRLQSARDAVARAGAGSDLVGADPALVVAAGALGLDLEVSVLGGVVLRALPGASGRLELVPVSVSPREDVAALGRCIREVQECRSLSALTSSERLTLRRAVRLGLVERGVRVATERGAEVVAGWSMGVKRAA